MRINEVISEWIKRDGSLLTLANRLNMPTAQVSLKLSGLKSWTWDEVVTVAKVIGSTPNELAGIK